jgi:ubiquinone/menaquinone biosynthesis C-methylase UbiE
MQKYLDKENYVTVYPDPNVWEYHANVQIIEKYKEYIKGDCCDAGANHCSTTIHLLKYSTINSIYALDINVKALEVAYETIIKLQPSIPFNLIACNLTDIKLEDNKFNYIQSFHTLEHIYPEDAEKVISEIYRILNYDGIFLISIPYDHSYPDPHHVNFFNVDSLCLLLEKVGFKTIECMKDNRFEQKDLLTGLFIKQLD